MKCDVDVRKDLYSNIVMVSLEVLSQITFLQILTLDSLAVPPCTPVSATACRRRSLLLLLPA
jgi:hypothetical protein